MIRDAELGQVDLILTKEVSRFARNTVDALAYTRKLRQWGVGVIFINDNIDTRDNDGELRLTIMASIAQEESRKTSERVKWGQKRRMEAGIVFGNHTLYGFTLSEGALEVNEEEAAVVRRVFYKFLREGKGTYVIARELGEEGIDTPTRRSRTWSSVMILRILRNEKYVGDLLQKKYVTTNFLTHKKEANRGREEQIYLRDHHAAVIDRSVWEETQRELECRSAGAVEQSRYSNRYWCSGKIRCGNCGSRFVLRQTRRPNGDRYRIWGCRNRICQGGRKEPEQERCTMRMVNEKTLTACIRYVLDHIGVDWDTIITELLAQLEGLIYEQEADSEVERLAGRQTELERKKERMMDAYFGELITENEMIKMKGEYDRQLEAIKVRVGRAEAERSSRMAREETDDLARVFRESIYSECVFAELVECVEVFGSYLVVRISGLPMDYRLWYSVSGRRETYTVSIDRCEVWNRGEEAGPLP
ncbi:MAG: tnpR 3 [Oscillospiraceae bacterium]|nr:tnpR 3 [Oscillospiraceae bacterium]